MCVCGSFKVTHGCLRSKNHLFTVEKETMENKLNLSEIKKVPSACYHTPGYTLSKMLHALMGFLSLLVHVSCFIVKGYDIPV